MVRRFYVIVLLFLTSAFAYGQKMENIFGYQDCLRLNHWWLVNGGLKSQIGYGDVNWQSADVRGALRFRANGWISLEIGALWAYIYDARTFREQEFRTHQSMFVRSPKAKRLRFLHEFRLEERRITYKPVGVTNNSSRLIYKMEPRIVLSQFTDKLDRGVWFAEGVVALNFNMKSELPTNDFFQRATVGAGIGYVFADRWAAVMGYTHQLGYTKPYYYGEEHGLNSIAVTFRHSFSCFE